MSKFGAWAASAIPQIRYLQNDFGSDALTDVRCRHMRGQRVRRFTTPWLHSPQTSRRSSTLVGCGILRGSEHRIGAEDERLAGRVRKHPEKFFRREAGLAVGGCRDDDAVEVFNVPESFECVDRRAAALDASVYRDPRSRGCVLDGFEEGD